MDLNKKNMKNLMILIVFAVLVLVGVQRIENLAAGIIFLCRIVFPFILGGAMAFILNIPLHFLALYSTGFHIYFQEYARKTVSRSLCALPHIPALTSQYLRSAAPCIRCRSNHASCYILKFFVMVT